MISAAVLGLCHANARFDPSRGVKFITYATPWIKREILIAINDGPLVGPSLSSRRAAMLKGRTIQAARMVWDSGPNGENPGLLDALPADTSDPIEAVKDSENRDALLDALAGLPAQQYAVIVMRFGVLTGQEMTLKEIGEHVGLSRERIRQIETMALERLRRLLKDRVAA